MVMEAVSTRRRHANVMMDGVPQQILPIIVLRIVRCERAHQTEHGQMYPLDRIQLTNIKNVQIEAHVVAQLESVLVSVALLEQLAKEISARMIALGTEFA